MSKQRKSLIETLGAERKALERERASILAKSAPLHRQRDALVKKIAPLENKLRDINAKIKAIEQPALTQIGKDIAAAVRALPTTKTLANGEE